MANLAKVKMKCVELNPAAGGGNEVVVLEEVQDPLDATKHNIRRLHGPAVVNARLQLAIHAGTAGAAQFKKDQLYVVSFLETT